MYETYDSNNIFTHYIRVYSESYDNQRTAVLVKTPSKVHEISDTDSDGETA